MPEVIKTRNTSMINLPMTAMNALNYFIWTLVALWIMDAFMLASQGLGVVFNTIQIMFYLWAKKLINPTDTPKLWPLMSILISFFKHFAVQEHCKDMKDFFWADENTQEAQTYIKQYQDDINELQVRYIDQDQEKNFEQHMNEMRKINEKLTNISRSSKNSNQSTADGSGLQRWDQNHRYYYD
jgi:hypothetical protein